MRLVTSPRYRSNPRRPKGERVVMVSTKTKACLVFFSLVAGCSKRPPLGPLLYVGSPGLAHLGDSISVNYIGVSEPQVSARNTKTGQVVSISASRSSDTTDFVTLTGSALPGLDASATASDLVQYYEFSAISKGMTTAATVGVIVDSDVVIPPPLPYHFSLLPPGGLGASWPPQSGVDNARQLVQVIASKWQIGDPIIATESVSESYPGVWQNRILGFRVNGSFSRCVVDGTRIARPSSLSIRTTSDVPAVTLQVRANY
jgi:hypothetical protein